MKGKWVDALPEGSLVVGTHRDTQERAGDPLKLAGDYPKETLIKDCFTTFQLG